MSLKYFLKHHIRPIFIFLTLLIDVIALSASSVAAFFIRKSLPNLPLYSIDAFYFVTVNFSLIFIVLGLILGLYRYTFHTDFQKIYFLATKVYIYSVLILFTFFYLISYDEFPRRYTTLLIIAFPIFFLFFRLLLGKFGSYLQQRGLGITRSLIVGYDEEGIELISRFQTFPELGYEIIGIVVSNAKSSKIFYSNLDNTVQIPIYKMKELDKVIAKNNIDGVFIPLHKIETSGFHEVIELCKNSKLSLKILSKESENLLRFAYIRDMAGITLVSVPRLKTEYIKRKIKRIFDIIISLFLLLLLTPIFILISIAIVINDGFPIIFKQKRSLVKGGIEFDFYKFRSMYKDAEIKQKELYNKNETTGGLFMMKNDRRVTSIGKLLRKFSLDELPQFFNVLKGDMSIVGPRPLSLADLNNISEENTLGGYYQMRGHIKPGVTGLWQISGRREVPFKEMILLDLYYIENHSILFDLEIILETIPVVLFGRGAY